ncbi:macro domain-containing protein [Lysinibacillus sp. UGB7]|uniref:macro domain-containing protein n=1 Tax=Lysinibacillus sp. UGB7 TaxID=3411039 RepID=UPI003B7EBAB2
MIYKEIFGYSLFDCRTDYVLAHCVSRDFEMGKGIALEFSRRNPQMKGVMRNVKTRKVGDALTYFGPKHVVINLITKEKYNGKPTRATFNQAVISLRNEMLARGFYKLAIPLIGSGLDRLDWSETRKVIKDVFQDTPIQIFVIARSEEALHSA